MCRWCRGPLGMPTGSSLTAGDTSGLQGVGARRQNLAACLISSAMSSLGSPLGPHPIWTSPTPALRALPSALGVHLPSPTSLDGLHHPVQSSSICAIRPAHTTSSSVRLREEEGSGSLSSGLEQQEDSRHECREWGCGLRPQGPWWVRGPLAGRPQPSYSHSGGSNFLICAKRLIIARPIA